MIKKLIWLNLSILLVITLASCGGKNTDPVRVVNYDTKYLENEGVIVVDGVIENSGDVPKLVYIYVGLYGDFGMVKDKKKKLMNNGLAIEPGEKLDFNMEFPFDPEVKNAKCRVEAKDPK